MTIIGLLRNKQANTAEAQERTLGQWINHQRIAKRCVNEGLDDLCECVDGRHVSRGSLLDFVLRDNKQHAHKTTSKGTAMVVLDVNGQSWARDLG